MRAISTKAEPFILRTATVPFFTRNMQCEGSPSRKRDWPGRNCLGLADIRSLYSRGLPMVAGMTLPLCVPRPVKYLILGAALALPLGCAKDRVPANVTLGKTRAPELKADIGEPTSTKTLLAEPEVRRQLGQG